MIAAVGIFVFECASAFITEGPASHESRARAGLAFSQRRDAWQVAATC